jgi:hypothetical protein
MEGAMKPRIGAAALSCDFFRGWCVDPQWVALYGYARRRWTKDERRRAALTRQPTRSPSVFGPLCAGGAK